MAYLAAFRHQIGVPTPGSRWVAEAYAIKAARLASTSGPRIVIVAGSGALFGLDSHALEAAWGRPVVNYAVNAGLTLPYILHTARESLSPGDIALLPLEYSLYQDDGLPNGQIIDLAVGRDRRYWLGLTWTEKIRFAAHMSLERLAIGWHKHPDQAVGAGTYGAHHIDTYGDQTHTDETERGPQEMAGYALARHKVWNYGQRDESDTAAWTQLRDFARWAKARQVCILAIPPAIMAQPAYQTNGVEHAFYASLPERVRASGLAFLGDPVAFMYPAGFFFDTEYHLTHSGRTQHTRNVITLLGSSPEQHCATRP